MLSTHGRTSAAHHLDVSEEAEMEKKVARMLDAIARPIRVLPVPGGPNSSSPRAGARAPCSTASFVTAERLHQVSITVGPAGQK